MPPFLPLKRSAPPTSSQTARKRARLADALDAEATNNVPTFKKGGIFSLDGSDSTSTSTLSDVDSDQFEDVVVQVDKAQKINNQTESDDEEEGEEEDIEWEDAADMTPKNELQSHVPMANGPIQITLRGNDEDVIDYGTSTKTGIGKKGPSKREKAVRIMTHKLHVQFLLWHNAVRNNWIGDKKVQEVLVTQLPPQIVKEVDKWRSASGLTSTNSKKKASAKGTKQRRLKGGVERNQRDWGQPSQRLEVGKADMSHGDPLIMLMKVLSAYWKKRFAITAPGLRKRGYGTKHDLKKEITSLRNDEHDPERHGERIRDLTEFRKAAEKCEGSRDVGAQLYTALLRGLGIEARLVASLQPTGYGWTKAEQMLLQKPLKSRILDDYQDSEGSQEQPTPNSRKITGTSARNIRQKSKVINIDSDTESGEEKVDEEHLVKDDDDDSIIDVTPSVPKLRKAKYDRDLIFPIYWTEAVSPITSKVLPVSPLVLETPVATSPEALLLFEPRGAKAEKAKQVMAYVVAYSPDGTAKDVTVRYLRKNIWPGKTKGFRIPTEKVPIYDKRGRITRHEDYDWFKHLLSPYARLGDKRTSIDDLEDSTDLVPQKPESKNDEEGVDTVQSLKASADYVLERFLRREEALRPGAEPVRSFVSGKGDKYKKEPVYLRADVERCLTAESWHKEGRRPRLGEAPMKMVPVRAVTLTRKREAEEHERLHGEKQMQGLYSWDQTEWIIPPPIIDGVIPKNAYGNMDCFVPSMVPRGAVHIPLKGTVRVCKRLDIDFAEAVTGFEFGNKRAVPVCTGVVVARENERLVKDAWREWNEEQRRKEETKMEKLVLDLWRKFVLGLRIRERVQDMYGEDIGVVQETPTGFTKEDAIAVSDDDQSGGGFVNEHEEDEEMGGGFLLPHEDDIAPMEDLVIEDQPKQTIPATVHVSDAEFPTPSFMAANKGSGNKSQQRTISMPTGDLDVSEVDSVTSRDGSDSEDEIVQPNNTRTSFQPPRSNKRRVMNGSNKDRKDDVELEDLDPLSNGKTEDMAGSADENEDEEDSDAVKKEMHTSRATRAGSGKAKLVSTPASTANSSALPTKRTRKTIPNNKPKVTSGSDTEHSALATTTRGRGKARGRSQGRPRKSRSSVDTNASTPKRSTRLSRKESTLVTSPYFE